MKPRTVLARCSILIAACALALSLVGAVAAANSTTPGWQLVAKASDRNSRTPDATILSEEVSPATVQSHWVPPAMGGAPGTGTWFTELIKPQYRVVTQSTHPGNRLTWEVTCYVYVGSYSSTRHVRGRAWPGRGKRYYAITVPTIDMRGDDTTANCFATVSLDAPWGRVRTLGLWLQERWPD
jgi:hypothetical protein